MIHYEVDDTSVRVVDFACVRINVSIGHCMRPVRVPQRLPDNVDRDSDAVGERSPGMSCPVCGNPLERAVSEDLPFLARGLTDKISLINLG